MIFGGNGYGEEWHKQAEKRGLPNLKSTTDVLPVIKDKETVELFTKYKVYTEKELESRFNILCENYVKQVTIEAKTALLMAKTMIFPAALRYQTEVAASVSATKAAGATSEAGMEVLWHRRQHRQRPDPRHQGADPARSTTPATATPTPTPST